MNNNELQELKQNYFENGRLHCPFCQSDNIETKPPEVKDDLIYLPVICFHCSHSWKEVLEVVDIVL